MEAIIITFLIIWSLFALACGALASKQGRSVVLAVILGFFFTVFALIGYAIAGDTEEKKIERYRKAMQ